MEIPTSKLERFAAELIEACGASRQERITRGISYKNVFLTGDENGEMQLYPKTFAYIDDVSSLLYSPVGLRLNIGIYGQGSPTTIAKNRAAASNLHGRMRRSNTDTVVSDAVTWGLVKGNCFVKLGWDRGAFAPHLVQPEMLGVLHEHLNELDENMEAFTHSTYISKYQFQRMIWNRSDATKADLMRKAKKYMQSDKDGPSPDQAFKQVIVGGIYPFQPAGGAQQSNARGIVDWMGTPAPQLDPKVRGEMLKLDQLWVWNDRTEDWATFSMIGNDLMLFGRDFIANALAFDSASGQSNPDLKAHHPFIEFCPNPIDGYFWGRSEIDNVALLQFAINARLNGINSLLRLQEQPPKKFTGTSGVNQLVLSRMSRPGGYFADSSPNAKVEEMTPQIPADLFHSLTEYERMFDEMGGLPPIAKGRGEAGVRSQAHAETLVRMFSPRFKDRAILIERNVESVGGLALDLCRAHVGDEQEGWVHQDVAGIEASNVTYIDQPPAPGLVPVKFLYSQIDDEARVGVDAHSSSPAFAAEARALVFDLFKIGAASKEDVIMHTDAPDPEDLIAGVQRRDAAEAQFLAQHPEAAGKAHGKKK